MRVRLGRTALGAILTSTGCSPQPPAHDAFVQRLDTSGFFEYAQADDAEATRADIGRTGWRGIFGASGRLFPADAESLAEGGVGRFLEELRPVLERQGIELAGVEEAYDESSYSVLVRGARTPIWTSEDALRAKDDPGFLWGASTARLFGLVNDLLSRAHSPERLYAVNGGNDLMAIFLTEDLYALIRGHPDAEIESLPYLPTFEPPWYGQGHE